jgi:hypothetical protein
MLLSRFLNFSSSFSVLSSQPDNRRTTSGDAPRSSLAASAGFASPSPLRSLLPASTSSSVVSELASRLDASLE